MPRERMTRERIAPAFIEINRALMRGESICMNTFSVAMRKNGINNSILVRTLFPVFISKQKLVKDKAIGKGKFFKMGHNSRTNFALSDIDELLDESYKSRKPTYQQVKEEESLQDLIAKIKAISGCKEIQLIF